MLLTFDQMLTVVCSVGKEIKLAVLVKRGDSEEKKKRLFESERKRMSKVS